MQLVIAAMVCAGLVGSPALAEPTTLSDARLWVNGDSNVRAFRCDAKNVDANLTGIGAVRDLRSLGEAKVGGAIEILVAALDCRNGKMNHHLRDALKMKTYKDIRLEVKSLDFGVRQGDAVEVVAHAELTLAGHTRPVALHGAARQRGDVLELRGEHQLKMTHYDVTPPRLMLGTIKVEDEVTVGFALQLKVHREPGIVVGAR